MVGGDLETLDEVAAAMAYVVNVPVAAEGRDVDEGVVGVKGVNTVEVMKKKWDL